MHIFLTGFTGVGKSTIGKELTAITGLAFIDLDIEIEKEAKMSIATYFTEKGEEAFRAIERKVLLKVIASKSTSIIALGGGTMCHRLNHKEILSAGKVVYLHMEWKELYNRIKTLQDRPTLAQKNEEQVRALFDQREPFYTLAQLKMPINSTFTPQKLANILKLSTIR